MSLATVTLFIQQLNIYGGIILYIMGIIGNILNFIIFSQSTLRKNSISVYMRVAAIFSLLTLQILITRILATGFQLDYALKSRGWCKIRAYFVITFALITLTIEAFSTVDRYFSSCRQAKYRKFSSMYTSKCIILCCIPICLLMNVPTLIFYDIYSIADTQLVCLSVSINYNNYVSYVYSPVFIGVLPFLLMVLFGILTYGNIKRIGRRQVVPSTITNTMTGGASVQSISSRRADVQLTSMILMNLIVVLISVFPYSAYNIYSAITLNFTKDPNQRIIEGLVAQTVLLLWYVNYSSCFYVFIITSKSFRKHSINLITSRQTQKRTESYTQARRTLAAKN
ncbi:unnamed protein product [Didymodactylos carnosus]|uniref:G-protein coupled receptors family 1 profile domain-containing protein n=1 Tax=Didymodactylos carnosus TaxID=1234261 RepID=A0A814MMQ0_9BILA|nr:unnamed protein product [Didymodactylos carnosus]CAF1172478.1 unnamed protein product [Didymodactylos carnosus]CAF3847408.1 unnamed protein product [Didymodactylos carnosus]CAF3983772.1 unnamed protein product [Didymodactylos carnosus]